ncbi:unnamed protein product [Parnassius mnemosyne]|uniref:Uncharacterized protein n=1 Tax=Parnassius mnemosyne TaxID=213953 RepID=A0AAV1LD61_9NEOP
MVKVREDKSSSSSLQAFTRPLLNIDLPQGMPVVGSSSYMACPLPLQLTNLLNYVGHSSSPADILISKFITQINLEHSPLHSSLSGLFISYHWQNVPVVQSHFQVFFS